MFGVDIKALIEKRVYEAAEEFQKRPDIADTYGKPLISYVDSRHPLFDMFFEKGLSQHPKSIFRPGNTVVLHFIPFSDETVDSNSAGAKTSPQWSRAFIESMWLSMTINGIVRDCLDTVGRLSSCTNTPCDWNEDVFHEDWSHKMAAYAAGMGHFGPAGSFITNEGKLGRFGCIITDGVYTDSVPQWSDEELEREYIKILSQCCYADGSPDISQTLIDSCPAGAISSSGIDRSLCQKHCKTLDEYIPSPEVCGKCFLK